MATWAYECLSPLATGRECWYVACLTVDALPAGNDIVRVRVGGQWRCARVNRSRRMAVDGALLRDVVASDAEDCPGCADAAETDSAAEPTAAPARPAPASSASQAVEPPLPQARRMPAGTGREVHAAAVGMHGRQFVVVLVSLDLVRSPGEADMAIRDLQRRFGGAEVVLMGQLDDGTPEYHGEAGILDLLSVVPVDRLPWKIYTLG